MKNYLNCDPLLQVQLQEQLPEGGAAHAQEPLEQVQLNTTSVMDPDPSDPFFWSSGSSVHKQSPVTQIFS